MKAFKVELIESERGWGSKVDDYMVCLTEDDAQEFKKEFNAKNNESSVPDWYMYAASITEVELTDVQFNKLNEEKRIYLTMLKRVV
jgi:hypothetical protein